MTDPLGNMGRNLTALWVFVGAIGVAGIIVLAVFIEHVRKSQRNKEERLRELEARAGDLDHKEEENVVIGDDGKVRYLY